jgi:hypothetical protein
MGNPEDGGNQSPRMTDPDKEDEIDEVKGPGNRMAHPCLPQTPIELVAEGKEGPEYNTRKEARHNQVKSTYASQRVQDSTVFLGNGFAIGHTIPLP